MKRRICLSIFCACTIALQATGQINSGGVPLSFTNSEELNAAQYVPQLQLVKPKEAPRVKSAPGTMVAKPAMIGSVTEVDMGFLTDGIFTRLADGSKIWRMQINMPGAKALGLYYDKFHLPQGVRYFLYNANRKQVLGAYTIANNPDDSLWATEKVQGETVNLELDIDAGVDVNEILLHINKVANFFGGLSYLNAYGAVNAEQKTTAGPYFPFAASSPCEINAVCPLGVGYPVQHKATVSVEYLIGQTGVAAGTATLMNNTLQDCTPYMLTASHVEPTNSVQNATYAQWLFYFNYEDPTCIYTGTAPIPNTMTGATFVARASYNENSNSIIGDFLMVKLKHSVPASFNAYFAGWDLDTTTFTGTYTGFHHPSGDVKKVSQTNAINTLGSFNTMSFGTHWQAVFGTGHGGFEEGSSGSGLVNTAGRLIGVLSGGSVYQQACTDTNAYGAEMSNLSEYSKFSRAWLYTYQQPSSAATRLKDWLDPNNSGLTHVDGMAATCFAVGVSQTQNHNNNINIYPNPTTGIVYATTDFSAPTNITIEVFDMIGNKISQQNITDATTGKYKIDLSNNANGMYMAIITANGIRTTKKIALNR